MKDNNNPKKDTLHSTWVRIVLIVLVFLMVASMATFTGIFLFNQIREKFEENKKENEQTENTDDTEEEHDHTEEGEKYY